MRKSCRIGNILKNTYLVEPFDIWQTQISPNFALKLQTLADFADLATQQELHDRRRRAGEPLLQRREAAPGRGPAGHPVGQYSGQILPKFGQDSSTILFVFGCIGNDLSK